MTPFVITLASAALLLACFKAYLAARLLEKDPEAWERLQRFEDEKRRRRQELLGQAALAVVRTVEGWFGRRDP